MSKTTTPQQLAAWLAQPDESLIKTWQVASLLGRSGQSVIKLVRTGKLAAHCDEHCRYYFSVGEVKRFLKA
ncbi:MAG: hypothetical protein V1929_08225 [bacterium]